MPAVTASPEAAPPRPFRIGALAPLSRPGWVEAGRHLLAGMELGVADVNAAGGSVVLEVCDTAGDPVRAERTVDALVASGVSVLAGEFHSVVARAVAMRARAHGIPYLCSSAVIDALVDAPAPSIARLAPPQSRGWRAYADYVLGVGHGVVALAVEHSPYWRAGADILRERLGAQCRVIELDAKASSPAAMCDALAMHGASLALLLMGYPEPALAMVRAVRNDGRLAGVGLGAPAGQPELASWHEALGADGAAVPFLRYLPERLGPLGERVMAALRVHLAAAPSFVGFEGYDTIQMLAAMAQSGASWPEIAVEGTRGRIELTRPPGSDIWQWAAAPLQVADRDPAAPDRFRVLRVF